MREDNVIYGLFAREGYERHDTSRQCCDGRCYQRNPSQGGSCPLAPQPPRIPRDRDASAAPIYAALFIAIIAVLCVAAIVDSALRVTQ